MSVPHFTCGCGWPSTSPSFAPSILHPSCFSPLCQDVGSVSRRGVKHSHEPAFPPPLTLSPKHLHKDSLRLRSSLQCRTQTDTFLKVQEEATQKRSPLCSREVGSTQNLCLHKRPDSKCWPSHLRCETNASPAVMKASHTDLHFIRMCSTYRNAHSSPENPQWRWKVKIKQSKTHKLYLHAQWSVNADSVSSAGGEKSYWSLHSGSRLSALWHRKQIPPHDIKWLLRAEPEKENGLIKRSCSTSPSMHREKRL